jgi:dihydrofolate synthase/folylpolyglutamate synthase
MTYPETIKYLECFINYEKLPAWPYKESFKLERIKDFLARIGNPQETLRCIHIAGTKGKGSTCAFITYILRQAGYKVGLYTSPHLSDFRERIRILTPISDKQQATSDFEGMISQGDLANLIEQLKPLIEDYNKNSEYGPLSFFEAYTALAFNYFKEKQVDFAVLETGLGGRLDATNTVNPLVCAITPISYEHTQKLGHTLKEIAAEKAEIIKNQKSLTCRQAGNIKYQKSIVISAPQEKEVIAVIRNKCKEAGARLYEVGKDITYKKVKGQEIDIKGMEEEYKNLKIRLIGGHQLINASVAVGVIEALRAYEINVGSDAIRDGLYNTVWPGRCEIVSERPLLVLDGAQNVASARVLKEATRENFKYKNLILVLGISNDKDIKGICSELTDLADEIILTKADNLRATEPEVLAEYCNGKKTHITRHVAEAKTLAQRIAREEDLVLVAGSLFVVGEFRHDKI